MLPVSTERDESGAVVVAWDGRTVDGELVESGSYEIVLAATDGAGNTADLGTPIDVTATTWAFLGLSGGTLGLILLFGVGAAALALVTTVLVIIARRRHAGHATPPEASVAF